MYSNVIKYSTGFWLNRYLSEIDLVNKYLLKTKHQIPKVSDIILSLNFEQILDLQLNKKGINSNQLYRIFFFYLFTFFSKVPLVFLPLVKTFSNTTKVIDQNYVLQLRFRSTIQQDEFFFFFFVEIWSLWVKQGFQFFFFSPFCLNLQNTVQLKSKIPLNIFYNFNFFFSNALKLGMKDEALAFITFTFKHMDLKNVKNCIKNMPFFWKTD